MKNPTVPRLLGDSLLAAAHARPNHVAIIADGRQHTYAELADAALSLASALADDGLRRGDRVAIYMDNGFAAAAALFGVSLAGGVFMMVNAQTKTDKLRYILEDSAARFLLSEPRLARWYEPAAEGLPVTVWSAELEEKMRRAQAFDVAQTPVDLASLIYTSGSTGNPKGVMMTHQSMVFVTGSLIEYLRLTSDMKIMNVLPLSFDYGMYQLLMATKLGATLVLEKTFAYAGEIVRRIREERVDVFPGVPTVYQTLIGLDKKNPLALDSVRRITNTAAALPADLLPALRNVFPNALIYKMYGLTECKRVSYLEPELIEEKGSSVGKAIPGTEVMVLDDDMRPVPAGEVGTLFVRGPHLMLGYWNQPEKTERMLHAGQFTGDRLLNTQDRFKMDEDGFLYFVGRSDDIIKTRGEKVAPTEVENVLLSLDGVREAAVVGLPDELLGQKIRAYVVTDLDERAIKKHCMTHLEPFMVPSEVVFEKSLPKTTSGKIRKRSLLERDGFL